MDNTILKPQDLKSRKVIFIRSNLYYEGMSEQSLYDAFRWAWHVNDDRANKYDCVLGVSRNTVVACYHLPHWKRVTNQNCSLAPSHAKNPMGDIERCFFICDDITQSDPLLGKTIAPGTFFAPNARNPISYFPKDIR